MLGLSRGHNDWWAFAEAWGTVKCGGSVADGMGDISGEEGSAGAGPRGPKLR